MGINMKVFFIAFIGINSLLFAHKIEGINLLIVKGDNNTITIEGRLKGSSKKLEGNKVQLISMIDKKVLFESFLENNKALIAPIPSESYWVYMYVGDQDSVEEGPPPKEGFKVMATSQKNKAFNSMASMSLFFVLCALMITVYKAHKSRKFLLHQSLARR